MLKAKRSCLSSIAALLLVTAVITLVAVPAAAKTKLVWWSRPHGGYAEAHNAIAELYMSKNPDVEVEVVTGYDDKLMVMLASGSQLDVIMANNVINWAGLGILRSMSSYLNRDANSPVRMIPPALMQTTTYQGQVYAIPAYWYTGLMMYNLNIWEGAGLAEPTNDWYWEDYMSAAKKMTKDLDGDGNPNIWGTAASGNWYHKVQRVLAAAGGGLFSADMTRSTAASPESMKAWQFMYDLAIGLRVMPSWSQSPKIGDGNIGMMYGTRSSIPTAESDVVYEVTFEPIGPSGKRQSRLTLAWMGIYAKSPHPEAAYELIKFIVSEEAQRHARASVPAGSGFLSAPVTNMRLIQEDFRRGSQRPYNIDLYFKVLELGEVYDADAMPLGATLQACQDIIRAHWMAVERGEKSVQDAAYNIESGLNAFTQGKAQ